MGGRGQFYAVGHHSTSLVGFQVTEECSRFNATATPPFAPRPLHCRLKRRALLGLEPLPDRGCPHHRLHPLGDVHKLPMRPRLDRQDLFHDTATWLPFPDES